MIKYQERTDMIISTASNTLATMSAFAMKWPKPRDDASPMTYSYHVHKFDRVQDPYGLQHFVLNSGPELREAHSAYHSLVRRRIAPRTLEGQARWAVCQRALTTD